MKHVRQTMSQLPMVPTPSAGLDSLRSYAEQAAQRARARANRSRGWMAWLVPISGVAALSVVLVISMQVMKMGYSTAPSESGSQGAMETPPALAATPSDQAPSSRGMAASEPSPGEMANQGKTAFAERPDVSTEPLLKRTMSVPPAKAGEEKASRQGLAGAPPAAAPRDDLSQETNARDRKEPAKKWASAPPKAENGKDMGRASDDTESEEGTEGRGVAGAIGGAVRQETIADTHGRAGGAVGGTVGGVPGGVVGGIASQQSAAEKQRVAEGGVAGDGTASGDAAGVTKPHAAAPSLRSVAPPSEPPIPSHSLGVQAAEARGAGDRQREVELLRLALTSGAQGQDRARFLRELCDALDALKRQAEADSACGDLIREFPNSDEAKAAVKRQTLRSKAKE